MKFVNEFQNIRAVEGLQETKETKKLSALFGYI